MKKIFTLLLFLSVTYLLAQQAYLVKDINTGASGGSNVGDFVEFKGRLYFRADDDTHGNEIWVSDGTPNGTHLFVDIESGRLSSSPSYLTVLGDQLYFSAGDDAFGTELWVTDGTPAGTRRITDINPGVNSSRVSHLTVLNNKLYFAADDGIHGVELWESDGTVAGTRLVKDIRSGSGSSYAFSLVAFNNKLYFSADDGIHGTELWESDGTETGTKLVADIFPEMNRGSSPSELTVFNNKLYFAAQDSTNNTELWESDGTEAGTKLVVDVTPSGYSFVSQLTVLNDTLYFRVLHPVYGWELWKSDGTPSGTNLVKDIYPGSNGSGPFNLYAFQNKLYFSANDGSGIGNELWISDGTELGTQLLKDIYPGTGGSNIREFYAFGNRLFFRASSPEGRDELWVSDGTEIGTSQFLRINKSTTSSNARYFINYDGIAYFQARDNMHGTELWRSDGTEIGTYMVNDNNPGSAGGAGRMLGVMSGKLYFVGNEGVYGRELWETDGTEAGTKLVKDINPGSDGSGPYNAVVWNDKLYFTAYEPVHGTELWVSDGTESGTQLVKDINLGTDHGFISQIAVFKNKLYFGANDGIHGVELWESDGTEAGTHLVKDVNIGTNGSSPRYFEVYDNKLYFNAWTSTHGNELWVSDGTEAGTQLFKDILPGTSGSQVQWLEVYQNKLYFGANDGVHGYELWESDGTESGTQLAVEIREGTSGSSVREITVFQNRMYLRADDGVFGTELWESDGTPEGTSLVADMRPGSSGSSLDDMVVVGNRLFFNADDGIFQEEVWAFEPFDCSTLTSTILYVSPSGNETNSGLSWGAATTLNSALKLAKTCASIEEIWVQGGTYVPGVNRYETFSIPDNIKIYGGFAGTETTLNERDRKTNATILNGDIGIPNVISGNTFTLLNLERTDNVVIDGFIIEEANAEFDNDIDDLKDTRGGGTYLRNANNNTFANCIFRNNLGQEGAAIYHTSGNNNKYINCLFYGNEGQQTNAFFIEEGTASFINCTLVNNTATSSNGILGSKDATITLINSVVDGSHTTNFNTTGTGSLVSTYSYLKGENPSGTGNIDGTTITDVLFKDVANNDYTLQGSSLLIDKGNNSDNTAAKGLGGKERIIDGDNDSTKTIDIGAFEFGQAEQTITFGALTDVTYGASSFELRAVSTSGLPVSYSSSDTSVATISGNTVTIVGAGMTTITASQVGNDDFKPAIEVLQDLKVNGREITITADAGQSKVFGNAEPVFTYTITTGSLINSDVFTGVLARTVGEDVGLYPITQGSLVNTNYDITFEEDNFKILKADQVITFNSLSEVIYGDIDFDLNGTSDSGLAILYTSLDPLVATVSGNTVTIVGVGSTTITASQTGNGNYNEAIDVPQVLNVTAKEITVTADSSQGKVFGSGADPVLDYSITLGSLVGSDVLNGSLERTIGEDVGLYPIDQGSLANSNYDITFIGADFEIIKADQTITFDSLSDVTYGDAEFNLNGTSDSGLTVSYSSSDPSVATVSGNRITIVGAGTTTITASQVGNGNYNAAITVLQELKVLQRRLIVSVDADQEKVFGTSDPVFTYDIVGTRLINGDVLSGSLTRVSGEDTGTYPILLGTLDNTNYDINIISESFTIIEADQTIDFPILSDVTYGDADFNLNATASSGLEVSYSSSDTSVATILGNTVTIVGAGQTTISAIQRGNGNFNPAGRSVQTLIVNAKGITVSANFGQGKVFGHTEPTLTYVITSGSLIGSDTLNGNLARMAGEDVGFYPINQGTLNSPNYDITFVTDLFEITPAVQLITFNTLDDVTYGDADFNLSATSDASLMVSYTSSNPSVATVLGNIVTIVGVGSTTIIASQSGNNNYFAASPVNQILTVNPKAIAVTTNAGQSKVYGDADPTLAYSITSGSLVGSDVLNGSLSRTAGEDVGLYPINQGSLANSNYDITFIGVSFEITKADQTITFNSLSDVIYGASSFELRATSTSGLSVSYTSSDTSVATVSGNTVMIVGVGSTTITASQLGNSNYNAAIDVPQVLNVTTRAITVTTDSGQNKVFGDAESTLTYSITSGSLVGSDVLNGSLARTAGEDVGLYPINQGTLANTNYDITFIGASFEITPSDQTITFNGLSDVIYGDVDFNLNGTASSSLEVSYESSDTSVATVSGSTVTIVGVGSTTITASQLGNSNYNTAITIPQTLTVNPRAISITADAGQSKVFGGADPVLGYSITTGNLVGSDVLNGSLARTAGEAVGMYLIHQGSLANTNYDITYVGTSFEIIPADQTITFSGLSDVIYGDADFNLNGTASSGLEVSYKSSDTSVATVSGSTLTIVGVGSTTITASQLGNLNYNAAIAIPQTLIVNPRAISVTADTGQGKVFGETEPTLEYSITSGNLVGSDVLNGSLERTSGEDVGFYPIHQGSLANANYDITFIDTSFEIAPSDQTITFNPLADVIYGDLDFNLNATSDSGLAISYSSSDPSVATVSGNTVTIIGIGSTTITASQIGDSNYNGAIDIPQVLNVTARAISVTADTGQGKVFGETEPTLEYSITTGNLVGSDVFTGALERTLGEDVGMYPIHQGSLANVNYDITFIGTSFEITPSDQTITFNPLADVIYGDLDFNLNGTASSGLEVSYESSDTSVATVSGSTVTIVGVGSTTITASQIGNSNYNAAIDVSQVLNVAARAITVTANADQSKVFGDVDPTLIYSISSGSLVGNDVLNGSLARTAGEDVGLYPINQGSLANTNYDIIFVGDAFEIIRANQTITFNSLNDVVYGDTNFNISAISSNGLAVNFSSSDENIAQVSGNTILIRGAGTAIITAFQSGNGNQNSAIPVQQTLVVHPRMITVSPTLGLSKTFGNADPLLTYEIISDNLVTGDTLSGNLERSVGEEVGLYAIQQGTLNNSNYEIAYVQGDFEILKSDQELVFNLPITIDARIGAWDLNANTNSGLPITFSSSDESIVRIEEGKAIIVGSGKVRITAKQQGGTNYNRALSVTRETQVISIETVQNIAAWIAYPNPTVDVIYLKNISPNAVVTIYDINGKPLIVASNYIENTALDVSNFASGTYLIEVNYGNSSNSILRKFLKD